MNQELFAGIDLHKHYCFISLKDQNGSCICRKKILNKDSEIELFFKHYSDYSIKAVVEATSNYYWLFETLNRIGISVVLAHPLKVRAIADAKIKSDKIDADILADLLRSNMIPCSYIPHQAIRSLRELVRHRMRIVHRRSNLKIQLRDVLTKAHYPDCFADIAGKTARTSIARYDLPPVFRMQCDDIIDHIDFLNAKLDAVNQTIKKEERNFPEAARLQYIRGIGIYSALVIISEIGDIHRFASPKKLVRFAGLCPGLHQSGNVRYTKSITKEGSRYLRWILTEAVWHAIKVPGPLRDFFFALKKSRGVQKAVVATARKMLVGIYYVLRDNAEFNPVRNVRYQKAA